MDCCYHLYFFSAECSNNKRLSFALWGEAGGGALRARVLNAQKKFTQDVSLDGTIENDERWCVSIPHVQSQSELTIYGPFAP